MGRERTPARRLPPGVPAFRLAGARLFVPDGLEPAAALSRTTHLGVGAHADDLEIMAFPAIAACEKDPVSWFCGVTCLDGARSPRSGAFAALSDEGMAGVRAREQEVAAAVGRYGAMVQLGYSSTDIGGRRRRLLTDDLEQVLRAARPQTVFTHHPADSHDSHVAVAAALVAAVRRLPRAARPRALYGGEVWRGLDWLPARWRVAFDVSHRDALASALLGAFPSQIAGGKRYDLAVLGRRRAHATYGDAFAVDDGQQVCLAFDLTPLLRDDRLDPVDFVLRCIDRFRRDVAARAKRFFR